MLVDWLKLVWDLGRLPPRAEAGLLPGPMLLEKLPLDVDREDTEVVRDDTDDAREVFLADVNELPMTEGGLIWKCQLCHGSDFPVFTVIVVNMAVCSAAATTIQSIAACVTYRRCAHKTRRLQARPRSRRSRDQRSRFSATLRQGLPLRFRPIH